MTCPLIVEHICKVRDILTSCVKTSLKIPTGMFLKITPDLVNANKWRNTYMFHKNGQLSRRDEKWTGIKLRICACVAPLHRSPSPLMPFGTSFPLHLLLPSLPLQKLSNSPLYDFSPSSRCPHHQLSSSFSDPMPAHASFPRLLLQYTCPPPWQRNFPECELTLLASFPGKRRERETDICSLGLEWKQSTFLNFAESRQSLCKPFRLGGYYVQ